jgi:hypothetical protein
MTRLHKLIRLLAAVAIAVMGVIAITPLQAEAATCYNHTFSPFSSSDGTERTVRTVSNCKESGDWKVTIHVKLYDTLCDNREAGVSWFIYDEYGLIGDHGWSYWGGGCNTSHTYGPYTYTAYTARQSIQIQHQACNWNIFTNVCSTTYYQNTDWYSPA